MPRPRKRRFVQGHPVAEVFTPERSFSRSEQEVVLPVEGLEAIRLSDLEGLDQPTAAAAMNVSRQTFGRVLAGARALVAEALVTGKTLRIAGGDYELPSPARRGGHRRRRGQGFAQD